MRFAHPEQLVNWPQANLVNPTLRGPELYIINTIFAFLATATVFFRFYLRIFERRWIGLDDYLLGFAWLAMLGDVSTVFWGYSHVGALHFIIIGCFVVIVSLPYQWNRHIWDALHPEYLVPGAKTVMAAKLFWAVASCFIRFSLLALFYRLLSHIDLLHRSVYKWVLHAATFFNVGILLSYLGTIIFDCADPAQYFQWPGTGYCINETYANVAMAALNTFAEALMAALPIPVIMSLGMSKRQRRNVLLLLCLGFLVSVVGTVRTYYVWKLFDSNDLTWYTSPHWICSEVEICTAMLCACAPALRSFVGRVFWSEKPGIQTRSNSSRLRKNRSSAGSNDSSKQTTNVEEGWVPPTRYQYDLEGIGLDGFGYTVTISGPKQRKKGIAGCFQGTPADSNERVDQPPRRHTSKLGRTSRRSMRDLAEESDTTELKEKPTMSNSGTREIKIEISPQ